MKKRNKAYKPKLIRIPMMKEIFDTFGMQMHVSYDTLIRSPNIDAFDALAQIFNVVTVTASKDNRFEHEMLYLNTGIATMNQIYKKCEAGLPLKDHEAASIRVAVNAIERVLPYMDVSKLYVSMQEVRTKQWLSQ